MRKHPQGVICHPLIFVIDKEIESLLRPKVTVALRQITYLIDIIERNPASQPLTIF